MKSRRIASLLCLTIAVSMFSGCGKAKKVDNAQGKTDDKSPITFTYFNMDAGTAQLYDNFQSEVAKEITKRTGVTLQAEFGVGDPKQKIALMAASEDYPDFIFAGTNSNIIADAGGFIPLDDLIEKYGKNIKKVYGDNLKRLRWSKEDPSIYLIGINTVGQVAFEPPMGFELQNAVLKELGYPKIRTLQDFENAIKTYKDKHPTIDGKPVIGLSLLGQIDRFNISVTNPALYSTGGPDDGEWYYDTKTQKAILHLRRPEEKEYYKWLNHMYNIGLLDPESFVQKLDQYQAKIASGRVLALTDSKWQYAQAETSLTANGMADRTYAMLPVTVNENYKYAAFRPTGYSGGWGIGISKKCKNPERAMQFLDWMASDEGQILRNWGIEGVHYTVADGERKQSDEINTKLFLDVEYTKKVGVGLWSYPFPGYGQGVKDPTGNYYSPAFEQTIIDKYPKPAKETLAAYGAKMWRDLYPQPSEFKTSPYGELWTINIPADSKGNLVMQKYQDTAHKMLPQIILGTPAQFDEQWDKFQKALTDVGCDSLEEEFNKLIKERIDLWNK